MADIVTAPADKGQAEAESSEISAPSTKLSKSNLLSPRTLVPRIFENWPMSKSRNSISKSPTDSHKSKQSKFTTFIRRNLPQEASATNLHASVTNLGSQKPLLEQGNFIPEQPLQRPSDAARPALLERPLQRPQDTEDSLGFRETTITIAVDVSGSTIGNVLEEETNAVRTICNSLCAPAKKQASILP